jgi:predicted O-methyltransferase YrrM
MTRYDQLLHVIDLYKPESIVEIGTWNGQNAVRMIKHASRWRKNVKYIGYDLFEDASDQTDKEELNVKDHYKVADVETFIKHQCPNVEVHLIKGDTRKTLNPVVADLAYIDGGHSVETIKNDYEKCKGSSVVIFDDYYLPDNEGKCPDTSLYGCNKIVDDLPGAVVLPVGGKVKDGGITMMAQVFGVQD